MVIKNIGVMSPGDMGQAVALQLKQKGFNVLTALDKRSARSKALAQEAGLTDAGSIENLTAKCEVLLSIMNPGAALDFAGEVAQALATTRRQLLFVDCNAVAPGTLHAINAKITGAGGRCADASIIGSPPRGSTKISLYVSGKDAADLEQLSTPQIAVRMLSDRLGDASAIKMCYGAINKGMIALVLELLIAARRLGVETAFIAQVKETHNDVYNRIIAALPVMPPKAYRWVPEMLQIAQTFEGVGLTPRIFHGAADMYEFIAATQLGKETPESRDKSRGGNDVVRLLAEDPR